jgi:hypothetical protein
MARRDVIFVLTLSLWGCGDDQSLGGPVVDPGGGGGGGGERIGLCSEGAQYELIDDMEDPYSAILAVAGRGGNWFAFNDDSDGAKQTPRPNINYPMERLDVPRDGSLQSVRTHGFGFREWGAGIGFEINSTKPYDASAYAGVAFWGRRGPTSDPTIRADVTDHFTAPAGGECDQFAACNRSGNCDPSLKVCYDTFGVDIELTEDWVFYEYLWSDMFQLGWSGNPQESITQDEIYGMRFQTETGAEFDVWIDDIAFVCP